MKKTIEQIKQEYPHICEFVKEDKTAKYPYCIGTISAIADEKTFTPSTKIRKIKEVLALLEAL